MTDIHTLELSAGGFRSCKWNDVMKCLRADHVTHLRRFGRTIAIRPLRVDDKRVWRLDKAVDGISLKEHDCLYTGIGSKTRIVREVCNWLNNGHRFYKPGDDVLVEANQNARDGIVLATHDEKVLIEYEMPGTTSGRITSALLEFEDVGGHLIGRKSRPHRNLPKVWLKALQNGVAEHYWIGRGQRSNGVAPFPTV